MKNIYYECYETGCITEHEANAFAGFVAVKKYDVLYSEELHRFKENPLNYYALPYSDEPSKFYNGLGRGELHIDIKFKKKLTKDQKQLAKKIFRDFDITYKLMKTEDSALQYLSLFEKSDNFELIWVRNCKTKGEIPNGYKFIGYDIAYPCDCFGSFSIINDCMFICCWHGCDEEGTLFIPEFNKLNDDGLFNDWQSAYDYMVKYLNEDWTERGRYCIYEIYKKAE